MLARKWNLRSSVSARNLRQCHSSCRRKFPLAATYGVNHHSSLSSPPTRASFLSELRSRGLVNNVTNEPGLEKAVEAGKITAYCGVDPTADSLHLGNLMTLMPLLHLQIRGHNIIPLIGGFTCRIGDPSGRLTDREILSSDVAANNISKITHQVHTIFNNARKYASARGYKENLFGKLEILNNESWWKDFKFSDFLKNVARFMRLGPMLSRESVKVRLQSPEGLDAASFLYQSLQAYDFLRLYQSKKCQLQIGGSDQWGNITAGIELCQKSDVVKSDTRPDAYGLTVPLLLSPSGEKLGKSAGNALFLDPNYTHPFDLYQYFLRTLDDHAEQYLKIFTLLPLERIAEIITEHSKAPERRVAQRILAEEVVTLIHRAEVAQKCIFQTAALYPGPRIADSPDASQRNFRADLILQAFRGDDAMLKRLPPQSVEGMTLSRFLKSIGLVKSYSEGIRAVQGGGVYVNGVQRKDMNTPVSSDFLLDGKVIVLRCGKSNFKIVEIISAEEMEYSAEGGIS